MEFWPKPWSAIIATRKSTSVCIRFPSATIIPFDISHCIPETNELLSISPSAHQPALFLTQLGTSCDDADSDASVGGMTIIPSLIRYCIPCRNDELSIWSVAHQPALFFIQAGILESCAKVVEIDAETTSILTRKITKIVRRLFFGVIFYCRSHDLCMIVVLVS